MSSRNKLDHKRKAIRNLEHAIDELHDAIRRVRNNRFEFAEDEIGEALKFLGRSIQQINRVEVKKR